MPVKTQGTTLSWNAVSVGEVVDVAKQGTTTTKIPIGSFLDTNVKTRPGRKKVGTFVFTINMNPDAAIQVTLNEDNISKVERTMVLVAPSGTIKTRTFTGIIMDFTRSGDHKGIWTAQLTVKLKSLAVRT